MNEIGIDEEIDIKAMENQLFENFGDKYLTDMIRIISTKSPIYTDNSLIHEALCIMLAMYMQKIKDGEINQNRDLH